MLTVEKVYIDEEDVVLGYLLRSGTSTCLELSVTDIQRHLLLGDVYFSNAVRSSKGGIIVSNSVERVVRSRKYDLYSGVKLKQLVKGVSMYSPKCFVKDLYNNLQCDYVQNRIYGISGRCHSGKTTALLHVISRLGDFENILYISFRHKFSCTELDNLFKDLQEYRYIFMDNVDLVSDFGTFCDKYIDSNNCIVISGTFATNEYCELNSKVYLKSID